MKRRNFIKNTLISTTVLVSKSHSKTIPQNNKENIIRGFIISDAHIGWSGKQQPSIEVQSKMVEHIHNKFPNLDIVFDTGDIHHGNLLEDQRLVARDQWLTNMANIFSTSLFHYIPGNHELGRGVNDTELTASKLGSQNFKPYYSFDYKGIHFVSLPQLLDTIYINQESLDWLTQDLEFNKEKTTLIFSHNSLSKTTFTNGESGYREVINSDEVFDVINKHNNVIAWFHGHNHQYEIVKKHERLYISNGRIGGFNPPKKWGDFGQGHLGGIYFEIDSHGLVVKCYSASKQNFLANLGFPLLSNSIIKNTSISQIAPTNYYYGYGAITQNLEIEIYNHYLSNKKPEVYLKSLANNTINDNFDFRYPNKLYFAGRNINKIIGYQIVPKKIKKQSVSLGLKISNDKNIKIITLNFPTQKQKIKGLLARGSYFRCYPEDKFKLLLSIEAINNQSTNVFLSYHVLDEKHGVLFQSDKNKITKIPNKEYSFENIVIPKEIKHKANSNKYYLFISLHFENFEGDFIVHYVKLNKLSTSKSPYGKIVIKHNNKTSVLTNNKLINKDTMILSLPKITSKTCLLIKVPNVQWQIRNAIGTINKDTISLTKYRHDFQKNRQVIITPTFKNDFYINKINNLMPCKIIQKEKHIQANFDDFSENSSLVIITKQIPSSIKGAKIQSFVNSQITLIVKSKVVEITCN